jgi:hypothetical protein
LKFFSLWQISSHIIFNYIVTYSQNHSGQEHVVCGETVLVTQ